jgi:hypothetical protein
MPIIRRLSFVLLLLAFVEALQAQEPRETLLTAPAPRAIIAEVPGELRDKLKLDLFYKKHADIGGSETGATNQHRLPKP